VRPIADIIRYIRNRALRRRASSAGAAISARASRSDAAHVSSVRFGGS
jgi:hypothetical protein